MVVLEGKSVFGGIAIGKLFFLKKSTEKIIRYKVDNTDLELKRFEDARLIAIKQLEELYNKAFEEVGESNAMIIQIHQMMLEDIDYLDSVKNIIITQGVNAEYAVGVTGDNFAQMFSTMEDDYMVERATDVKDISERVIGVLSNHDTKVKINEPVIIAADDLAPSETIQLDKNKILSFITRKGSVNSHTAILARNMNIPAVIGIGDALKSEYDGMDTIIDGFTGTVYIEPNESIRNEMTQKKKKDEERKA